ncbi:MAG: helical backbone metal receptor [Candidatus Poseidoniaceae archaeon]|nr:helical backbone metal receptor [Candidatus Poseidoniaceae archaeon]
MRIVSLVPSLTLTLFDLGCTTDEVVGRTPWCVHPEALVANVPVVGGTKTPNINKILAASPDVVVLDREENPKAVYEALNDAGITVYASSVEHPNEVPKMLRELGAIVNRSETAERFACELEALLIELLETPLPATRVAPMIWHDPLMSVGPEKYAGGLLTTLGLSVPSLVEGGNGYPVVTVEALKQHNIEALLLSSEPHRFALEEGEDIAAQVIAQGGQTMWCKCIDGEALTWFGTHTAEGLRLLRKALN